MKKVVIADDNQILLEQLEKNLKECKEIEIVGIAHNGEEELKCIKEFSPDVVVTDIEMPKMTGVDVIEAVKDFEQVPEFIVITGGASAEIMQRLYKLPIKQLFYKPLDMKRLECEILMSIEKEESKQLEKSLKEEKSLLEKFKNFFKKI